MWIFPSIKPSWHSFSMWDKFGCLNWLWVFLCRGLSSFNRKGFYYLYAWSCSLCKGRTSFCPGLIARKLCGFLLMFSTGFTWLSVLLFFLYWWSSSFLCTVFDATTMDKIFKTGLVFMWNTALRENFNFYFSAFFY